MRSYLRAVGFLGGEVVGFVMGGGIGESVDFFS